MDDEASLRQAVEEQARALVDGDLAKFASYVSAEALPPLYRAIRVDDVRSAQVMSVVVDGDSAESVVQLQGDASCELRGVWLRTNAGVEGRSTRHPSGQFASTVVAAGARPEPSGAAATRGPSLTWTSAGSPQGTSS